MLFRAERATLLPVITMKKQLTGTLAIVTATVIWGSAFVAQSMGMDKVGPFTFQTSRCVMAVLFLLSAIFISAPGKFTVFLHDRKLWRSGMLCGCALFVATGLQQVGLLYTDAGKAGFLTAMYIVLVPFLGLFLGHKPPKLTVIALIPAVGGLYLLSCVGVSTINPGDILMVGCAFAFAVQITLVDRFAGGLNGLQLNCVQCMTSAVLSAIATILTEQIHMPDILSCAGPICYAGVLSLGVAYTLQIMGQQRLEPTTASLLMSLESVFAVLSGWLILHETMSGFEIAGCVLMFVAVILAQVPVKTGT